MENKIKEVQDYFKNKIANGEYIISIMDQYTTTVLVDGKYTFGIWHANSAARIEIYHAGHSSNSFMYIEFDESEKEKIFQYLYPLIKENTNLMLIKQKELELLKLKETLNN